MSLKFKLLSMIFALILAITVTLSVFTLTNPNRDVMVATALFAAVIIMAATVNTFFFARIVARQITDATNTLKNISEREGGLAGLMTGNFKDETGALEGTVINIQSAAKTLVKNNVSVEGLIESYEAGIAGMQDVMADFQGIVHSIDDVLQQFETIDQSGRVMAKQV